MTADTEINKTIDSLSPVWATCRVFRPWDGEPARVWPTAYLLGCRFHTRCPAVIQPEECTFDQEVWRNVMDLRIVIREQTLGIDDLRERASDTQLRPAIRSEYDVPEELSDPDAERVLAAALSDVVAGDSDAADERLDAAFSTVCEREHPNRQETETGHPVACHLHDIVAEVNSPESVSIND
jgi:peptide/nickel transport system ATP-binding protein